MKRHPIKLSAGIITATSLLASGGSAADYTVQRTLQLASSATDVWHVVGDFCDIDDWHPEINACSVKVIDGKLHRVLAGTDGTETVERRIAVEAGLSYTYKMEATSLPVDTYTATFSIEHLNGSLISWSVRFTSDDPAAEGAVTRMIEIGLKAIDAALD